VDELIQLIPFIIIALTLLGRAFRRKKPRESEPEAPLENEQEVTLPPWGNIETMDGNTGLPDFLELEAPSPSPEPAPSSTAGETQPPPDTRAPKPIERPTLNQTEERRKVTPVSTAPTTIAGISLTPKTFRQGIILREILGPPKSLQRRRAETGDSRNGQDTGVRT
jgi:hypothetical protein